MEEEGRTRKVHLVGHWPLLGCLGGRDTVGQSERAWRGGRGTKGERGGRGTQERQSAKKSQERRERGNLGMQDK